MPSSTSSSSEAATAVDRHDPTLREIPAVAWPRAVILAVIVLVASVVGWEMYWRSQQLVPSYRNSGGLWAMTHRKIDRQPTNSTAVIGSSRVLFDFHLEAWERETGQLPVQLALEGSNPRPVLDHLANDTDFAGLLVVGVTPPLFFTPGFGIRADALERYREESPSQWLGQRISMQVEPYLAFYDPYTALFTVIKRQKWPVRLDPKPPTDVPKLSLTRITRQNDLWDRVASDPEFNAYVTGVWTEILEFPRKPPPPEAAAKFLESVFVEVTNHVNTIRERGGEVVFVRCPSDARFREIENMAFPRERFFDVLIERTESVGVHFEDHDELQGFTLPEWSHIRADQTEQFTTALVKILKDEMAAASRARPEMGP